MSLRIYYFKEIGNILTENMKKKFMQNNIKYI